ncbi:MAG: hypothetical protein K2F96_00495, partial [Muribaculaceae bacterium]|nr:hypothetical protein [Muribaculaceae bacterium]
MIAALIIMAVLLLGAVVIIVRLTAEKSSLQARLDASGAADERFRAIATQIMTQSRADMRSETTSQVQTPVSYNHLRAHDTPEHRES